MPDGIIETDEMQLGLMDMATAMQLPYGQIPCYQDCCSWVNHLKWNRCGNVVCGPGLCRKTYLKTTPLHMS
ncbi:hypothetical protein ACFLUU_06190 [Chloroflexota bacterium]